MMGSTVLTALGKSKNIIFTQVQDERCRGQHQPLQCVLFMQTAGDCVFDLGSVHITHYWLSFLYVVARDGIDSPPYPKGVAVLKIYLYHLSVSHLCPLKSSPHLMLHLFVYHHL